MGAWFQDPASRDATPRHARAIPRHATMFTVQVPQYTGLRATRVTKVRTTRFVRHAIRPRATAAVARAAAWDDDARRLAWREVEGFEMYIRACGARGGGAARVMTRGDGVKYFVRAYALGGRGGRRARAGVRGGDGWRGWVW